MAHSAEARTARQATGNVYEIARTQAAIDRCEAKLAAVRDELSKYYYRQCIAGHRAWLAKLQGRDSNPI